MNRIYLDSNVLIAYYSTDRAEETKKKAVEQAFAVFADLKDCPALHLHVGNHGDGEHLGVTKES
jgi:hypothetical protein